MPEGAESQSNVPEKANSIQKDSKEETSSVTALEWSGPDDADNPLNWSFGIRLLHVAVPSFLMFSVTLGSSIYMPAYPLVVKYWGLAENRSAVAADTLAVVPFTSFILGLCFGPVLGAPISETKGRRFVYLVCIPIYAVFLVGSACANDIGTLIVLRFFAAFFGSPPLAVAAGTVADIAVPNHRALMTSIIALMAFVGPGFGVLIGSFVVAKKDWQWTQWTALIFIGAAYLGVFFTKETYKKVILLKRLKKSGANFEPPPGPKGLQALKFIVMVTLTRPIHMLFVEPIVLLLSAYVAFNFAVIYAFFVAFPYVFTKQYGFTEEQTGLSFISIIIGASLGAVVNILCDILIYRKQSLQAQRNGKLMHPEARLYGAQIGSILAPIGLFWFAFSAKHSVHWISPMLGAVFVACGNVAIFVSVTLYLIDTYDALLSASALAANGIMRYVVGAVFPLFTLQMYTRLHVNWATALLGFIALAMLPIPWAIFVWGHGLRMRSKYQTTKV